GPPADSQAPSTPTALAATPVSINETDLNWTPSTDNVGVTGYVIERCGGDHCTDFSLVGVSSTSFYQDFPCCVTTYTYRVRGADGGGRESGYAPASVTPSTALTPIGLSATTVSASEIDLHWNAPTGIASVRAYLVERCQGIGCTDFRGLAQTLATN